MANLEWEVAHELVSPYGSVKFNDVDAVTGRVFRIQSDTYRMVPSLRVTQDNVSQADGSVLHPRWTSGLVTIVQVAYNIMVDPSQPVGEMTPACGNDLREMHDELVLHLNAIRRNDDANRLYWTPTGLGDRQLLANIQLLAMWDPSYDLAGTEAMVAFAVESPFPYAIASTQVSTVITDGSTVAITNAGTCPFSPVVQIDNQGSNPITLTNLDDLDDDGNPLSVVYDDTRPGAIAIPGGHYAELDFFQGTCFEDGSGADLIAAIDPTLTDFWHLNPGANNIVITGADCTVLSNDAWA
jgi:hypothetical protein